MKDKTDKFCFDLLLCSLSLLVEMALSYVSSLSSHVLHGLIVAFVSESHATFSRSLHCRCPRNTIYCSELHRISLAIVHSKLSDTGVQFFGDLLLSTGVLIFLRGTALVKKKLKKFSKILL